jgi:bifunctional DNA-binding transcriptional regulator/antitoxin component of YhaV-PrlF toxin-antitoxin module
VTLPVAALRVAGLGPGDVVRVEATRRGQVVLSRVEDLVERYSGALDTGGRLRGQVEELRNEWE